MHFVDTHCHIHEATKEIGGDAFVQGKWAKGGFTKSDLLIEEAKVAGVNKLICVGCTLRDSEMAVELAKKQPNCYAAVGIHPHEAKDHLSPETLHKIRKLVKGKNHDKIVAIGEAGLDYFYEHSPKAQQVEILKFQLELAAEHELPLIFHVRDAFDDFLADF